MSGPWQPDPEPGGALEPPRRRPPTAVGLATPPPPRRDRSQFPSYSRYLRRRRIARAIVGSTMAISAVGFASIGGIWMALASAVLGISGSALIFRSIRGERPPLLVLGIELHSVGPAWIRKPKRPRAA